jgi:uncharacterized phage protein gp47/JayE
MDSYDEILNRMKEKYKELSGNDVPQLSDIDIRMKVLAGEIYNDEVNLDFIKRQMFAQSATDTYLDLHASDRGLVRKEAVKATGSVVFSIPVEIESSITIPAGTIVATSDSTAYRFITDEDAVITSGSTGVTVSCTAEKGGIASNVSKGKISIIVTSVTGVETVTNVKAFSGGVDAESDESLRKRILESYITISNGTNGAYYKKLALSVDGVTSANVVAKIRGKGTVDVYIWSGKTKASTELISKVQAVMDKQRELNVDVKVYSAISYNIDVGIYLTVKDGYAYESVASAVKTAVSDYIASLSIGDNVLESYLGRVILDVEGVYDYRWASNSNTNFYLPVDVMPVLNSMSIEEDTVS